jgi:hypothetical protein
MRRAFLAAVLLGAARAAAPPPPPGALFNLSSFQLQLPLSNGRGGVEIIQPAALATYTSEYFYTDAATRAMVFWAPENGAHTSGSMYPRSELRQIPNFFLSGRSQLNVTMAVRQLPSTGAITVGQIHFDKVSGSCSIVIELEYQAPGNLVAHLRDAACRGVLKTVGSGYRLGESFSFSLTVDGLAVQAASDSGTMAPYAYDWPISGCGEPAGKCPLYFKTGDYVQAASNSATKGGVVAISDFSMFVAG